MFKRFKVFIIAALLATFCFAIPAQASLQDMWAAVYKWEGGINADGTLVLSQLTSGIQFKVLARSSDTAETLYYPHKTTSLTNPVTHSVFSASTVCENKVNFLVDPTDAVSDRYVDLIVVNNLGGFTAFVKDFDQYTHTIVIDQRFNQLHQGTIWFTGVTTTEVETGIRFLQDTYLEDVRVEVVGVSSAQTIDVGIKNVDSNGLRTGVLLTTAGYVADTAVVTSGASYVYYPASTYGALLKTCITGYGTTYTGGVSFKGYVITDAVTAGDFLTYQASGATETGYIHYWFNRIRR